MKSGTYQIVLVTHKVSRRTIFSKTQQSSLIRVCLSNKSKQSDFIASRIILSYFQFSDTGSFISEIFYVHKGIIIFYSIK